MKEQLISFETAKLAKEKGFNEVVIDNYGPMESILWKGQHKNSELRYLEYSAPTQSSLQKWLRDKHGINANSFPSLIEALNQIK
ncbi:hypothetical protein [Spongiimicrobium salis]|uniref:hypothetical protein n=1 Tax=Spongiimicrobium salis TaxID=1667022 RepID=UPI00374CFB80